MNYIKMVAIVGFLFNIAAYGASTSVGLNDVDHLRVELKIALNKVADSTNAYIKAVNSIAPAGNSVERQLWIKVATNLEKKLEADRAHVEKVIAAYNKAVQEKYGKD